MLGRSTVIQGGIISMAVCFLTMDAHGSIGYSRRSLSMARKMYQQQMMQQAATQKMIDQAEQHLAETQAADERRQLEVAAKASRARHEKEARHREAVISQRKAENAAKATEDTPKKKDSNSSSLAPSKKP